MEMDFGKLRDCVQFQTPGHTSDGRGGEVGAWTLWVEEDAWIERLRSLPKDVERLSAGGISSQPIVRIWVRASDETEAITTDMRAYDVDRNAYFNINAAQDIAGDGRWITVTATQNAPA